MLYPYRGSQIQGQAPVFGDNRKTIQNTNPLTASFIELSEKQPRQSKTVSAVFPLSPATIDRRKKRKNNLHYIVE